jgi:hypothetical protein
LFHGAAAAVMVLGRSWIGVKRQTPDVSLWGNLAKTDSRGEHQNQLKNAKGQTTLLSKTLTGFQTLGKRSNRRTGTYGTRLQSTVATWMVVDGPADSHDPVRIVTGSKGLLLDVGLDYSLLLVIDRFDGDGDVISA